MKEGGQRKHSFETIALAMELETEGISWDLIEEFLGEGIKRAVEYAKAKGM